MAFSYFHDFLDFWALYYMITNNNEIPDNSRKIQDDNGPYGDEGVSSAVIKMKAIEVNDHIISYLCKSL